MAADDDRLPFTLRPEGIVFELNPALYGPAASNEDNRELFSVEADVAYLEDVQGPYQTFQNGEDASGRFLMFAEDGSISLDITGYHTTPGNNFPRIVGNMLKPGETAQYYNEYTNVNNPIPNDEDIDLDAIKVVSLPALPNFTSQTQVKTTLDELFRPGQKGARTLGAAHAFLVPRAGNDARKQRMHGATYIMWLGSQSPAVRFHLATNTASPAAYASVNGRLLSVSIGAMAHNRGEAKRMDWFVNLIGNDNDHQRYLISKLPKSIAPSVSSENRGKLTATLAYYPTPLILGNRMRVEFRGMRDQSFGHVSLATINAYFINARPHIHQTWVHYLRQINPIIREPITAQVTRNRFIVGVNNEIFPGASILAPPEVFAGWLEFQKVLYLQKLREVYFSPKITKALMILGFSKISDILDDKVLVQNNSKLAYLQGITTKVKPSSFMFVNYYYCFVASCILSARMYRLLTGLTEEQRDNISRADVYTQSDEGLTVRHCVIVLNGKPGISRFIEDLAEVVEDDPDAVLPPGAKMVTAMFPRPGAELQLLDGNVFYRKKANAFPVYLSEEQVVMRRAQDKFFNWYTNGGTRNVEQALNVLYSPEAISLTTEFVDRICNHVSCPAVPGERVHQTLSRTGRYNWGHTNVAVEYVFQRMFDEFATAFTLDYPDDMRIDAHRMLNQARAFCANPNQELQNVFEIPEIPATPGDQAIQEDPLNALQQAALAFQGDSDDDGEIDIFGLDDVPINPGGGPLDMSSVAPGMPFVVPNTESDTTEEDSSSSEAASSTGQARTDPLPENEFFSTFGNGQQTSMTNQDPGSPTFDDYDAFFDEIYLSQGQKRGRDSDDEGRPPKFQKSQIEAMIRKRIPNRPRLAKFLSERIHQHLLSKTQ